MSEMEVKVGLDAIANMARLAQFGQSVLEIMESDEDWGGDTLQRIATSAADAGVVCVGSDDFVIHPVFRRKEEETPKHDCEQWRKEGYGCAVCSDVLVGHQKWRGMSEDLK